MPRSPTHAVVWLAASDVECQRIKSNAPHRQVHHKANETGSGHVRDDRISTVTARS